jgi:hypothetical protein
MDDYRDREGPEEHCLDLEVENLALRARARDTPFSRPAQTLAAGRVRNGPADALGERLVTWKGRGLGREKELELARAHSPGVGRDVCPEGRDHEGLHAPAAALIAAAPPPTPGAGRPGRQGVKLTAPCLKEILSYIINSGINVTWYTWL